jgi:hypothetical protein
MGEGGGKVFEGSSSIVRERVVYVYCVRAREVAVFPRESGPGRSEA